MRSHRIIARRFDLDGLPLRVDYADVFVVIRDGDDGPGDTDWEANVTTGDAHHVEMARHDLALHIPDGSTLRGPAILRFSDGRRHLFRGDGPLDGFVDEDTSELPRPDLH